MQLQPTMRRRRHGRVAVGATAGAAGILFLAAAPAWGHSAFPSESGFGGAPNPKGSTSAPYAGASVQTLSLFAEFEQTDPFNGADDTTVDLKVVVPNGWTNPTCGAAKTAVSSAATNNTNQPGAVVPGWSCSVITENSRKVLHWTGPQVVPPKTSADSAQFFIFTVTTPNPASKTTYNGANGTEGFIADQRYASGDTMHWIPSAGFTGHPPAGSTTEVATGLARTVNPK